MRRAADILILLAALGFLALGTALAFTSPAAPAPATAHAEAGRFGTITADPRSAGRLPRGEGVSLMGTGLLIMLVRPLRATRGRALQMSRPAPASVINGVVADRGLTLPFLTFAVVQLLDMATTLRGASAGLLEGNPVAGEVAAQLGPVAGFLAMKVAALIALCLVMARLPRSLAVATGWSACVMMGLVVLHNVALITR